MNFDLEELKNKIKLYDEAYQKGDPIIDDETYDILKKQLEKLEAHHKVNQKERQSEKIGPDPLIGTKHIEPILSLEHGFGKSAISKFTKKMEKKAEKKEMHDSIFPLYAEVKIDGISLVANYKDGKLINLLTRGNGKYGEDVSHLKQYIPLPKEIPLKGNLAIRFEAYIENENLENKRNLAAGLFMQKQAHPNLKYIKLRPHNLYSKEEIWESYSELTELFEQMHLQKIQPSKICNSIKEAEDFFQGIEKIRDKLSFEIDGVVFKVNSKKLQEELGNTARAPRFAFAIKFESSFNITEIKDITFQVGRFGNITPVAELEPFKIKETNIKRATLHNFSELAKKNYAPGDIVKIAMSGDVIPYICGMVEKRAKTEAQIPLNCPSCKSKLINEKCLNGWSCPAQAKEKLIYFARKDGLNIKGMGEKQIEFFMEQKILKTPQDFFKIEKNINKIKANPSWLAEQSFYNLKEAIEQAKYTTLEHWYSALGIPHIGKSKAQKLASIKFEDFLKMGPQDLEFLGPTISQDIVEYIKSEKEWMLEAWQYIKINEKYEKKFPLFEI